MKRQENVAIVKQQTLLIKTDTSPKNIDLIAKQTRTENYLVYIPFLIVNP